MYDSLKMFTWANDIVHDNRYSIKQIHQFINNEKKKKNQLLKLSGQNLEKRKKVTMNNIRGIYNIYI